MIKGMGKRLLSILLATVMMLQLTGCSIGNTTVIWTKTIGSNTLFAIGDETCDIKEGVLVLSNYINLYKNGFADDIVTAYKDDSTLISYLKQVTLNQLAKMKVLLVIANEKEITLTPTEEKEVEAAAKEYYSSVSDKDRETLDISEEDIVRYYGEIALASKVYSMLVGGVNEEVSDDDARVMVVRAITVDTEAEANEITKEINNGKDFAGLQSKYSKISQKESKLYRQNMSELLIAAISNLNEGDITSCINENGHYSFYQVINKIDRELTEENKITIVKERAAEAFDTVYEEYETSLKSTYNYEKWDEVAIEKTSTYTFFQSFNNNLTNFD